MEQLEKENFLGLGEIFKKMNFLNKKQKSEKMQKTEIENESFIAKKKQQEQATKFLSANLYDLYFAMIKNGYNPTPDQEKTMNLTIIDKFNSLTVDKIYEHFELNLEFLNDCIEKGYKLNNEFAYSLITSSKMQKFATQELFKQTSFTKNSEIFKEQNKVTLEALKEIVFTDSFQTYAAQKWLDLLTPTSDRVTDYFDRHAINTLLVFAIELPEIILPKISVSKLIDFMAQWTDIEEEISTTYGKKITECITQALHKALKENYNNDIQSLLDTTKEVYLDSYLQQKTVEQTKDLTKNYYIKDLPIETQNIIKEIQEKYTILKDYKIQLNADDLFTIDNLFETKIPDILQKYFSITPEYRTNLKNLEGKNAFQLMEESLINYKDKLGNIVKQVNEQKISELSAIKRYSNSI